MCTFNVCTIIELNLPMIQLCRLHWHGTTDCTEFGSLVLLRLTIMVQRLTTFFIHHFHSSWSVLLHYVVHYPIFPLLPSSILRTQYPEYWASSHIFEPVNWLSLEQMVRFLKQYLSLHLQNGFWSTSALRNWTWFSKVFLSTVCLCFSAALSLPPGI